MSGNYVYLISNTVQNATQSPMYNAYMVLRGVEGDILKNLENSIDVFNLTWTDENGGYVLPTKTIGEKDYYDVGIPDLFKNDKISAAVLMSHEFLHATVNEKFGPNSRNSYYEEALASRFMGNVAEKLGYTKARYPWEYNKALLIDLNIVLADCVPLGRESGDFWLDRALGVYPSSDVDAFLRGLHLG
jgi:hypothetical protein